MAETFLPVSVNLNNTASWKRSKASSFMYVSASILISSFRESIYTALLACILFSWLAYNFIYIYLYLKYFLFFAERLETANRQLASRDFDGHEDKATEGLYATQSEYCAYLFERCMYICIYIHGHLSTWWGGGEYFAFNCYPACGLVLLSQFITNSCLNCRPDCLG